jgi:hypothetical protein
MNTMQHPIRNLTELLKKHEIDSRTNLARIALFYLKLILQEPFRILEEVNFSEKIRNHELKEDPIFIIGHWRSGTSFLQYLLGKDPQFAYMNKFQVVFPDIFLYSERFLKPFVESLPKTFNITQDAQNMSINLELDSPSEIEIALTTIISPTSLHWGHIFPENAREYFDKFLFFEGIDEEEIIKWKTSYHHLIKKISLKNHGRQVLIKSPGNTSRIQQLLEQYPKARFIFIHRNPYDVFYSSKKLWNTLLDNLALQDFTETQMEKEIIYVYQKLMKSYLKQRSLIPEGQLAEIPFTPFMKNPLDELQQVYQQLNLEGFEEAETPIADFLAEKASGQSSVYEYEDHIIKRLNEAWSFAFSAFDYPLK